MILLSRSLKQVVEIWTQEWFLLPTSSSFGILAPHFVASAALIPSLGDGLLNLRRQSWISELWIARDSKDFSGDQSWDWPNFLSLRSSLDSLFLFLNGQGMINLLLHWLTIFPEKETNIFLDTPLLFNWGYSDHHFSENKQISFCSSVKSKQLMSDTKFFRIANVSGCLCWIGFAQKSLKI